MNDRAEHMQAAIRALDKVYECHAGDRDSYALIAIAQTMTIIADTLDSIDATVKAIKDAQTAQAQAAWS